MGLFGPATAKWLLQVHVDSCCRIKPRKGVRILAVLVVPPPSDLPISTPFHSPHALSFLPTLFCSPATLFLLHLNMLFFLPSAASEALAREASASGIQLWDASLPNRRREKREWWCFSFPLFPRCLCSTTALLPVLYFSSFRGWCVHHLKSSWMWWALTAPHPSHILPRSHPHFAFPLAELLWLYHCIMAVMLAPRPQRHNCTGAAICSRWGSKVPLLL